MCLRYVLISVSAEFSSVPSVYCWRKLLCSLLIWMKKKAPYIYIYKRKFSLSALSNWFGFINTIVKVYLYILCEYVQLTTHGCYLSILYIVVKLMTTFASLYTNRFRFQNNILLFQKQPSLYIFVPKESRRGCSIKCILSGFHI